MPSIDRLGALPDALICHILSFIPTKFSVRTSILSRRWRFVWTHVPALDFNDLNDFDIPTRFSDIINRVMLLHKVQSIYSFCIPDMDYIREYELNTWITTAISRNVQNLDICFREEVKEPTLTRSVFTCKSLVNLSLTHCCIPSSGAISLPSLKKLNLERIVCEVAEAVTHLLSGCPVLEELIINRVNFKNEHAVGCLDISSPTVKRLDLWTPWNSQLFSGSLDMVKINAPALVYLDVAGCIKFYSIMPIYSLSEAIIDLDTDMLVEEEDYTTCSLVKFLSPLRDVKCLQLIGYSHEKEVFSDPIAAGSIPKFGNLTKLKLIMTVNWHFVMRLLESADNLEVLTVGVGLTNWVEPKQVPTCLLSRVRTIQIDNFDCTEHVYSMVKYILRNAQVLEKMDIWFRLSYYDIAANKKESDARKRIPKFKRGSKACKLVFSNC